MRTNDQLAQLGEPPATPEEEAEALQSAEYLERLRRGEPAQDGNDPATSKTIAWLHDHVSCAAERADSCELEELGRLEPKFKPIRWLASGGMGDVYLVRDEALDWEVALKLLRLEFSSDPAFVERFRREAKAMARLNHPHIARVISFGKAGDFYYLEMEYLAGGTLRHKLQGAAENRLSPKESLDIAMAICEALEHAHSEGVIHRDIKPENILFDGNNVKVADLGLAKVCGDVALTATAHAMGTWDYMAPEQRESAATVDPRADIYSVGVVLYEMLTGKKQYSESDPAWQKAGLTGAAATQLDTVIRRALKPDPDQRYRSVSAMKADINVARELLSEPTLPPPLKTVPGRAMEWLKQYRVAVVAMVGLTFVSLMAWWLAIPPPSDVLLWGGDANGGAPYVWEERGKLKGFEAELMEHIADRLKLRPKFVQASWDMLPQALKRGDVQVIFNGYEWTPERAQEMHATIPYGQTRTQLIVRKNESPRDWADLGQRTKSNERWHVGTLKASASEKHLKERFPDTVAIETPSDGTVSVLLLLKKKNSHLDASVQDEFTAKYYVEHDFRDELEMVGKPVAPTYMVGFTHRDNPELRDRINEALKGMMRDGTLKKIYTAYGLWHEDMEKLEDVARDWPPREESAAEDLWSPAWTLVKAAGMTVLLACLSMPLAMLLGLLVALGRIYGGRWLSTPLGLYVEILRGTPLLLQLFVIYFLLPHVGVILPAFWAAVIGLAINYSAYESEHYRAGLLAVPRGQLEAALTLGMSRWPALRRIILPQALRTVVPSITNDFIGLFKDTAVCSVIAVVELTGGYQRLVVEQPNLIVTFALMAGLLYLMMSYPMALLARRLERRPQLVVA